MSLRGCDADSLEHVVISNPLKAGEDVLVGGSRLVSIQGNARHIIIFGATPREYKCPSGASDSVVWIHVQRSHVTCRHFYGTQTGSAKSHT